MNSLKILYVSAEVSPYAKTGGLADVAGSLPQYLRSLGHDVRIAMPKYGIIKNEMGYAADFPVELDDKKYTCIVRKIDEEFKIEHKNYTIPVYFIDSYYLFDRPGIYCFNDDGERFIFFCKAILDMLPHLNFKPDIIHLNDWHTGPVAMLLEEKYRNDPFYARIGTLFTIHNLEYQGQFDSGIFRNFNMGYEIFTSEKVEFYGGFNFLKTGVLYSDKINAVSKRYAEEIKTVKYGEKMDGLLKWRAGDLCGIVNGISYEEFNPSNDYRIYRNYNATCPEYKKENKKDLQMQLGLPVRDVPVFGLISRLTGQKGLDLLMATADKILELDIQLAVLGLGDPYYERFFNDIQYRYSNKVSSNIKFDASLAQKIYAGSDIFLMPSRFEPCGLGQIISLRYGTIPVVRATGGLAETISDIDEDSSSGNGFSFEEFTPDEFYNTVKRAMDTYIKKPDLWKILVKRALSQDFSWKGPSEKYNEVYRQIWTKRN